MNKLKYITFILIFTFLLSCTSNNSESTVTNINKCPCDSTAIFNETGKSFTEYFFGKSLIETKPYSNNDTIEITRFYTNDTKWHVQEYLLIANDTIIEPKLAIYCEIKDTANFYKLTYNMNNEIERNTNLQFVNTIGVEAIFNTDTIRSKNTNVLVPKAKLKGIVKLVKRINVIYNGKKQIVAPSMFIEADKLIKYGNLLEQYKAITKLCKHNKYKTLKLLYGTRPLRSICDAPFFNRLR